MSDIAVSITNLSKMYKLYSKPSHKVLDLLGLNFKKNAYSEFWALRELNLEIPTGQRIGIIGRNGAGKSTLLKIIAGSMEPTEGSVKVNGKVSALLELGTGFHPEFTGRQNIHTTLSYQGYNKKEIRSMEEDIIDFSELEEFIDQPLKTYSAGMYARLAFSAGTVVKPEILIIDEVLGAGDAYFAGKCLGRMKKLTEESGATVLFVSHDLGSVQQMCERAIWVERGVLLRDGDTMEVVKEYYASILEQEDMRLKVKNKGGGQADAVKDIEWKELVFRLVTDTGSAPKLIHPVRQIMLEGPANYAQTIEPGTAMDNDFTFRGYLLTDSKFMNWSEPFKVGNVWTRSFKDVGGEYMHAPFIFKVPSNLLDEQEYENFNLKIIHKVTPGEDVYVEIYDGELYHRLSKLTPTTNGWKSDTCEVSNYFETDSEVVAVQAEKRDETLSRLGDDEKKDIWSTPECELLQVTSIDEEGKEKAVFALHETFGFRVFTDVHKKLESAWLVLVVYDERGNKVNMLLEDLGALDEGIYNIEVLHPNPNIRQGDYYLTIVIQPSFDWFAAGQHAFYCMWDRRIQIRIEEGYTGKIPLGLAVLKANIKVRKRDNA